MKKLALFVMLAGAIAAAQAPETKQEKPASPALTAEQIFDKYVDAIGGRERIARVKTIREKRTTQTGKNVTSSVRRHKAPDKYVDITEESNGAKTGEGSDGRTLWMLPPKLQGWRPAGFTEGSPPDTTIASQFRLHSYTKARLRGIKKVNDRQAYVVELSQGDGDRWTYYLDADTFLLLRMDSETRPQRIVFEPESGSPNKANLAELAARWDTFTYYYSDWRDVGGLKVPFGIKSKKDVVKILDYQIDSEIDDSVFAPLPGSLVIPLPKKAPSN
jgi:hypothetical protein